MQRTSNNVINTSNNIKKDVEMSNMVINALEYYDINSEKIDKMMEHIKYVNFQPLDEKVKGDIIKRQVSFFDKDKQEIYNFSYEVIGIYENQTKTWSWAWAIPKLKKNLTYISRKILNYGLDIEPENTNNTFLRAELITGRFRISNIIQLDLHVAIASYIAKKPFIFKCIYNRNQDNLYSEYIPIEEPKDNYSIYYLFILDNIKL